MVSARESSPGFEDSGAALSRRGLSIDRVSQAAAEIGLFLSAVRYGDVHTPERGWKAGSGRFVHR